MKQITALILLFLTLAAQAQDAKTLTLKDALKYALENKSDAKKARLDVENSNYEIMEVRSEALPQISANGSLTYNAVLQQSALPGEFFGQPEGTTILVPFGQKWNSVAGVSLTQNIFDMSVFIGLKAAKSTREFYQINATLTDEQVIERVANAYFEVFVAKEKFAVSDSNYVNTSKVRDIIKGQFDNGLAKKIDLDRTVVKLYNINTQRQKNLNDVQLKESALKFYIGMPVETPIVLSKEDIIVNPLAPEETPNVEQRTEYLLMSKELQLLTFQKKAEIAAYYPKLSLNANYNYQGLGNEFVWFGKPADGVYWTDYSSIGASISIPIFTGFKTKARVAKADIQLRKQQEDMVDMKLQLGKEYADAVTQINNNLITLKDQGENVKLAQEVMDDTQNNYYNGLASLTDLLDSENALIEAQNNYNTALLDYKLAEIQLIKSKGQLKTLTN